MAQGVELLVGRKVAGFLQRKASKHHLDTVDPCIVQFSVFLLIFPLLKNIFHALRNDSGGMVTSWNHFPGIIKWNHFDMEVGPYNSIKKMDSFFRYLKFT